MMGSNLSEQRVARIHDLDIKHRDGLNRAELIHHDEAARRLKVKLINIRDENAVLRDRVRTSDIIQRQLKKQCERTRDGLKHAQQAARAQEAKVKKQASELCSLKAEVESLGGSMQDSSKVLQEKFALTRELDRLRPEMEHLQSQLASNQAVVAEKNRLQRQLDSLEVELDNEKRARQRTQDRENKTANEELRSRAEDAERLLVAEKREREKTRKVQEKVLAEANTRGERMDEQISTLKEKVKSLQSDLKEAASDRHRPTADSTRQAGPKVRKTAANHTKPSKKRSAEETSFEGMAVDTPGNEHPERRPTKKRGLEHASMGEKSTFSVTPFLNRNKSMTEASQVESSPAMQPAPEPEVEAETDVEGPAENSQPYDAAESPEPAPTKSKNCGASKARGRSRVKPPGKTSPVKVNAVKRVAAKAAKSMQEEVPGAMDQENLSEINVSKPVESKSKPKSLKQDAPSLVPSQATRAPNAEAGGKKMRKFLGANSTIFDDDDGEVAPVSTTIKPSQAGKRKRAPLGQFGAGAFGGASFSPLKRDRRGVGVSFLG